MFYLLFQFGNTHVSIFTLILKNVFISYIILSYLMLSLKAANLSEEVNIILFLPCMLKSTFFECSGISGT
jgi:hypothetical protein